MRHAIIILSLVLFGIETGNCLGEDAAFFHSPQILETAANKTTVTFLISISSVLEKDLGIRPERPIVSQVLVRYPLPTEANGEAEVTADVLRVPPIVESSFLSHHPLWSSSSDLPTIRLRPDGDLAKYQAAPPGSEDGDVLVYEANFKSQTWQKSKMANIVQVQDLLASGSRFTLAIRSRKPNGVAEICLYDKQADTDRLWGVSSTIDMDMDLMRSYAKDRLKLSEDGLVLCGFPEAEVTGNRTINGKTFSSDSYLRLMDDKSGVEVCRNPLDSTEDLVCIARWNARYYWVCNKRGTTEYSIVVTDTGERISQIRLVNPGLGEARPEAFHVLDDGRIVCAWRRINLRSLILSGKGFDLDCYFSIWDTKRNRFNSYKVPVRGRLKALDTGKVEVE